MTILFVGGGTLGPVMPLVACARAIRRLSPKAQCVWIGTPIGPEAAIIARESIPFSSLPVAKLDRFPSWRWLTFPFDWARARQKAKRLIDDMRPDIVVSVGGYTAIPIVLAAAARGIPCATHQLDLEPGRTNAMIAKHCASVTTSFAYEVAPFGDRVRDERIATPVAIAEKQSPTAEVAKRHFGFDANRPVVLIFGGGSGAQFLNKHVARTLDVWLSFTNVLHGTGIGKTAALDASKRKGYFARALFMEDMRAAYAAADIVIGRGGMGTLSEIAWAKKTAIVVPIPNTHQETNARAFEERGAAIVVDQKSKSVDEDILTAAKLLLTDGAERRAMGARAHETIPTDDGTALAKRVLSLIRPSL